VLKHTPLPQPSPLIANATSLDTDRCALEELFCRAPTAKCATLRRKKPVCTKPLFITGTAGSGTHFVAHFLSKITSKSVSVKHESPTTSPDVLVSWPSRCPASKRLDFKRLGFPNPKDQKKPMVEWANKQLSGKCAYRRVVHLVRHPLKFLSSNFAFGQCLECWALVEHLTVPSINHLTVEARAAISANRRRLYDQTGGRDWDPAMRKTLVHAFMLYWVTWNNMIAQVADERIRVEDSDLRKLCVKHKLGTSKECAREVNEESVKKASHGGGQDKVTWAELEAIDAPLTNQMWALAKSFGYSREPIAVTSASKM